MSVEIFDFLKKLFNERDFRLYMIGSTSRDFLLGKEISDFDFVTDAKPYEVKEFLDVDLTFSKYGAMRYKYNGIKVDIVTLRKERIYSDFRHPAEIEFINDIKVDYLRRDFTINAIYINEKYEIEDISKQGYEDLINKKLIFIGDPLTRIKEDPLRILRAYRFAYQYDLKIDENTKKLLEDNYYLIENLNKFKVDEENKKFLKMKERKNGTN